MYRLIIADDEMIECMVLEHMIRNHLKDQIELLDSVLDGVSLLKAVEREKPDIAIVDINMPGLNGLDAIEILKIKHINIKIIIHTAYSEFAYAQKALQLGAVDYILKPSMKEEILETIEKTVKTLDGEVSLRKEHDSSKIAAQSLCELAADKWLMSLFLEHPDQECYRLFLKYCPDIAHGGIFTAWKIRGGEQMEAKTRESIYASVKEKLYDFCSCIGLIHRDLFYALLIPGEKVKQGDAKAWILKLVDFFKKEWKKESVFFLIGVSRWKEEDNFVSGIYEANIALQYRDEAGTFFFQGREKEGLPKTEMTKTVFRTAAMMGEGKTEECQNQIRQLFLETAQSLPGTEEERFMTVKIFACVYFLRLEEELGKIAERDLQKNFAFWKEFQQIEKMEDIFLWAGEEIRRLYEAFSAEEKKSDSRICRVFLYLMKNYAKDISLEEISDSIRVSPFYLTRLLKHQMNTTFVEMLTDIRIRKAVLLLEEGQKSVREIGALVGYPNQSYFYKVFKKTTGIALGDIRKYLP